MTATANIMQQDEAVTVFQKGAPGRRAFSCPELDVPQVDGLLPERFRRSTPAGLPESSPSPNLFGTT